MRHLLFFLRNSFILASLEFASARSCVLVMFVAGICFQRRELSLVLAITRGVDGEERRSLEKARNNGTVYMFLACSVPPTLPVTQWMTKSLDLMESAQNGCRKLVSQPLPSPTHDPRTYPWGHKTTVYLWLQNNQHQNDEQTYEAALTVA